MPSTILKRGEHKKLNGVLNWIDLRVTPALHEDDVEIVLCRPGRTKEQNDKGWPMYRDFEPIEFNGRTWKAENWKCFLLSAFNNEMPAVGLQGEPVSMSLSTSRLSKKRFKNFIEFVYAEGAHRGVKWSEPAMKYYEEICPE